MSHSSIPAELPNSIYANTTVEWYIDDSDHTFSGGWVYIYSFANSGNQFVVSGISYDSGAAHLLSIPAATTAALPAGIYSYQAVYTDYTDRFLYEDGQIELKPDLQAQTTGYDNRSQVKKTLDALENAILNRASDVETSYLVSTGTTQRSISKMSHTELIEARDYYFKLYQKELRLDRIKKGKKTRRNILGRFN